MTEKTFYTFFPEYEDFHFWKDPGQIPYRFAKLGYKTKIITRCKGEFSETKKHLTVECIDNKKVLGYDIGLILFFFKCSKKINILNVFHLHNWESLFAAFLFKLFNPLGFVYLKMDNCHDSGIYSWEKIFDKKIKPDSFVATPKETIRWKIKKLLIKKFFINIIDLFSVEDKESKEYFENKYSFFKDKLIVAYNGHTIDLVNKDIKVKSFEEKENLIITVGRLGTFQKNTMNLLKGFAATAKLHNWQLVLAGPVASEFINEKDEFFNAHPELEKRISFTGNLNKPELFDLYNRAKIFLLPSNFEGFAIVFAEAAFFRNTIITTPYTSIKESVLNKKIGLLVEPENPENIGEAIIELIKKEELLKESCNNAREFALRELDWNKIIKKIDKQIKDRL